MNLRELFDPKAYWEQRVQTYPGLQGVGHISLGEKFNAWRYRVRERVFRRLVAGLELNFARCTILDIGSGTGFYVGLWKSLGVKSLTGVDIAPSNVQKLRGMYPEYAFMEADFSTEAVCNLLDGQTFYIVSAFDVLYHIVDDFGYQKAIENIATLLTPGGYLLFSDHFPQNGFQRQMHQVSRPWEYVNGALNKTGFVTLRKTPMFVLMNAPVGGTHRWLRTWWDLLVRIVGMGEVMGQVLGMFMYPLELALLVTVKEGPTTEIVICQKMEGR